MGDLWQLFEKTGLVQAYMLYKKAEEEKREGNGRK